VFVVDDGLATGFTAIVGAMVVRKLGPASLTLAVPVSPVHSISAVSDHFNRIFCLYAQDSPSFAVASFYEYFHDMSDDEVRSYLVCRGASIASPGNEPPRTVRQGE
jgi:predicted phosphoribosyltransferase